MADSPRRAPLQTAASHVTEEPVQPIKKYSAFAPGAIFGIVTVPPLNLPATGVVNHTVATVCQPGFAAKKPSRELKFKLPKLQESYVKRGLASAVPVGAAMSSTQSPPTGRLIPGHLTMPVPFANPTVPCANAIVGVTIRTTSVNAFFIDPFLS